MRNVRVGILGLAGILLSLSVLSAPPLSQPQDVRNSITVAQFEQTGLDKLSPEQLQFFNQWLAEYLDSHTVPASFNLDNVMTVAEYHQAGLENLSPDQRRALNAWLQQYLGTRAHTGGLQSKAAPTAPATPPPATTAVAKFGADTLPQAQTSEPSSIESRIAGKFTGWSGNTVFRLENGQVWQQAATGYYTDVQLDHPRVVIKKLVFGYLLTLPGQGQTVFVRRIK